MDYGGTLSYGGPKRWMSGYTQYYNGMHNRITNAYQIQVGTPEAGKYVLTTFGGSANHAMTILGYNDSIRWDYNNVSLNKPEVILGYPIYDYHGGDNYMQGGTTEADKTIEFGLDLSKLLSDINLNQDVKVFLQVVQDFYLLIHWSYRSGLRGFRRG
ncbi:MAG: hypothetical protein M0Q51_00415 [Bacteroidales bacterium]|nr:hypothetical protein [Bacteroidales bacterium]